MKFLVLYLCFTPIFGIIQDESHMEGAAPPKGQITAPTRIDDRTCNGGDSCCTWSNRCGENEGDCDWTSQCQPGLFCGDNNCRGSGRGSGFDSTDDCCYKADCSCSNYVDTWSYGQCTKDYKGLGPICYVNEDANGNSGCTDVVTWGGRQYSWEACKQNKGSGNVRSKLINMGYDANQIDKAIRETGSTDIQTLKNAITQNVKNTLMGMGFNANQINQAIRTTGSTNIGTLKNAIRRAGGGSNSGNSGRNPGGNPSGGNLADYRAQQLENHNVYRRNHNSPDMSLDNGLNTDAQKHAEKLRDKGQWLSGSDHDSNRPSNQGENIGQSCTDSTAPDYNDVTDKWYSEEPGYDYQTGGKTGACQVDPKCQIGHFTQVVWKASTRLGVGKAKGNVGKWACTWAVARYAPAGNVDRQYLDNVQKPKNRN